MKKYNILLLSGLILLSTSCKKYLDVNKNPNQVTQEIATPELVLPAALSTSASLGVSFSSYGSALSGGYANAGGFSGFGAGFISYNYSTGDYAGLWSGSYDNLNDFQFIINKTNATGEYKYYNAIARTMKAFSFLRLVDVYGDLPYSQAFKGADNITPAYDKAEDVYKACIADLNAAITTFSSPNPTGLVPKTPAGGDIYGLSAGTNMTGWIKFAKTIKLRHLLRIQKVTSLASTFTTEMAALGSDPSVFVTSDILAQPGYFNQAGKSNPTFATWGINNNGALVATSSIPTSYITGFYDGTKITDTVRGPRTYRRGSTGLYPYRNQLGNQVGAPSVPTNGVFFTGTSPLDSPPNPVTTGLGPIKGYTQGQPVMLAAESYFMVAEANLLGFFGGASVAKDNFDKGILASITYSDKGEDGKVNSTRKPGTIVGSGAASTYTGEIAGYKLSNPTNYLVQFDTDGTTATTADQKLEAIITQKYIALNMITADQSWNDYKRTKYPKTVPNGGPYYDMASTQSLSTRTDKLPARILYPASEFSTNPNNVKTVNPWTTLIFWDIAATGGSR